MNFIGSHTEDEPKFWYFGWAVAYGRWSHMEVRLSDRFCFREYNMYIVPKFTLTVSYDGNPIIY